MMRFLVPLLHRLYKPVPTMDAHSDVSRPDSIARDVMAAVDEHERIAAEERDAYGRRLRETMDDLLKRMGKQDDPSG